MIIKNYSELATSKKRSQVLKIIDAGIQAVQPCILMSAQVSFNELKKQIVVQKKSHQINGRFFVIGGGKASGEMARVLERIIGAENITAGVINSIKKENLEKIKINQAGHPEPDLRGVQGVKEILALKKKYKINKNDTVIVTLSGGGSAMLPAPIEGISLKDKQKTTKLLLECGAKIQEINIVRQQLSQIKGGKLGAYFAPAQVIALIISDVVGNDLGIIASGPTVLGKSNSCQALKVLERYNLLEKTPKSVVKVLKSKKNPPVKEMPKCHNYIIGDLKKATQAMKKKASNFKLISKIVTVKQNGETTKAAQRRAQEIIAGKYKKNNLLILGGETTPTLPAKHGRGGRNQHYALVTLAAMRKYKNNWVMASAGSDGVDYMKNIAGAIVDSKIRSEKIKEAIDRYDSFTFLQKTGSSIIKTGNTGTNVGDLIVYFL